MKKFITVVLLLAVNSFSFGQNSEISKKNLAIGYSNGLPLRAIIEATVDKTPISNAVATIVEECRSFKIGSYGNKYQLPYAGEDNAKYLQRSKALKVLHQRCSDFTSSELGTISRTSHEPFGISLQNTLSDRYLQASLIANNEVQTTNILKQIIDLKDPWVIDRLKISISRSKSSTETSYWFKGKKYESIIDQMYLSSAFGLVACDLGLDCSENDFVLLFNCMNLSKCFSSRREIYQSRSVANNLDFSKILDLKNQIVESIINKRYDDFAKNKIVTKDSL